MMLTLMSGMAEFERALISERTSTAFVYKREKREAYAPTPLGYRREGKALLPDESELATVARIQTLSASGHSLADIARELNAEGVATKRGGRWHRSTVRYILQNELYASENAVA